MPLRPVCFMIMPYGTKATPASDRADVPAKVNFDRLWDLALRPAIEKLGYEPVRADQDLGPMIIIEMIERLALSDLVIADISIPNGNVYYEIGIRHAAQQAGCVMISADWAQPLFDLGQMRRITYPLPADLTEPVAVQIQEKLIDAVPGFATGLSPVFSSIPGYPASPSAAAASSFRKTFAELSAFQAEVQAIRSAPRAEAHLRAVQLKARYAGGGPLQKIVALELLHLLRDYADWSTELEFISQLPNDIQALPVVQEQKALAQSKTGDHLAAIGALRELIRIAGDTSERRGLLGSVYKKLSAVARELGNVQEEKRYLDLAIKEYAAGMTLDLNDYYPASNLTRLYRQRNRPGDPEKARTAAAVTLVACERARARNTDDPWLKPTLLGAAFDTGDAEKARELAAEVAEQGAAAWQLKSTIDDLERDVLLNTGQQAAELKEIVASLRELIT
jgi:tetratricopeptide (TPR) repeat protein